MLAFFAETNNFEMFNFLFAVAGFLASGVKQNEVMLTMYRITVLIFTINLFINPFLYYSKMAEFRREFNNMLSNFVSNRIHPEDVADNSHTTTTEP